MIINVFFLKRLVNTSSVTNMNVVLKHTTRMRELFSTNDVSNLFLIIIDGS